jgi:hypothetical protein
MAIGSFDTSIDWLLQAVEENEPFLSTARVSPAYDRLRAMKRWKDVEQRLEIAGAAASQGV